MDRRTTTAERIKEAVADPAWQAFRLSLKKLDTKQKIEQLCTYYELGDYCSDEERRLREIRVDNYIKALCRGGQLYKGESLRSMINCGWNPDIKS